MCKAISSLDWVSIPFMSARTTSSDDVRIVRKEAQNTVTAILDCSPLFECLGQASWGNMEDVKVNCVLLWKDTIMPSI